MGRRIRQAREAAGLSREHVARTLLDLDLEQDEVRDEETALRSLIRSMFRWEASTEPSAERLAQIADTLGVSMHWLATGNLPSESAVPLTGTGG